jgi:carboxyl-terminal processing protease
VRRGDIILKVDGTPYSGTEIDLAAAAIRGKAGTRVTLTLLRDGEEVELSIRREKIISQTVRWEWMDGDIAHIRIASFEESTASDFKKALKTVEQRGAKGFVLDLRDNPGGLVNASVDVADALMDKGTVVYSEDQAGNREYFHVKDGKTDLPFVVLVNEGSASASEILTAGLQDNGVALIVGTTTFGKGIIQQLEQLRDGSAINLTVMQYYSPKGHVIHGVGIEPDIEVEPEEEDYAQDGTLLVDRQLNRGWEIVSGQ